MSYIPNQQPLQDSPQDSVTLLKSPKEIFKDIFKDVLKKKTSVSLCSL
jgi:hypothetical protein